MRQLSVHEPVGFAAQRGAQAPLLLDVRAAWERAAARLELDGAPPVHIPLRELPGRRAEPDPARPVPGLCHPGVRGLQCVAFLLRRGDPDVHNIDAGIDAWSREVDPSVPRS